MQKVAYLVVIASDGADFAAEYILLGRQIASVLVPAKAAVCTAGGLLPILLLAGLCCCLVLRFAICKDRIAVA